MSRQVAPLSALEVGRLKTPGFVTVGGVAGLALQITPTLARSWVLRVVVGGRRRDIGLGSYPGVSLARARELAAAMREQIAAGIDPVAQRQAARSELQAAVRTAVTFEGCASAYIAAHEAGWKNAKHAQQWRNTLQTYAYPVIGDLLVRDVEKAHVLQVLQPIWSTKTETASRLRSRIELVLSYAMQAGHRPEGMNPARWRGGLDRLLPAPTKVRRIEHHAAVPVGQAGAVMQQLASVHGMGALALRFAVLTAARSGEVRGATWQEIDLESRTWTIPAERMKAGAEHRVPLSDAAIALLKAVPRRERRDDEPDDEDKGADLVFSAQGRGTLSDMTLAAVLKRLNIDATPHGFRSTFRDWAAERTSYPRDLAEMALAHTIADKTEAAYRRGDMLERRRQMMSDWAAFLATPAAAGNVVELRAAG